jgi:hypothetical protein
VVDNRVSQITNHKSQIPNNKWFGRLTTLSQVEGQITMTKIQNLKLDGLAKSGNPVTPANAGVQELLKGLDSGSSPE